MTTIIELYDRLPFISLAFLMTAAGLAMLLAARSFGKAAILRAKADRTAARAELVGARAFHQITTAQSALIWSEVPEDPAPTKPTLH